MNEPTSQPASPADNEMQQPSRATVSVWLSAKGDRSYSVKVSEGVERAEVDRLVDLALTTEARLRVGR